MPIKGGGVQSHCFRWKAAVGEGLLNTESEHKAERYDRQLLTYSVEKLDNLKMHDSSQEPFSSEVLSIYHV